MSNQVNSMNKGLTVKDLVTTGIFTALLFVFVLVGGVFFATNPVLTFFMPAGGGLLAGPIYLLLIAKVHKRWSLSIMGVIMGIIWFVTGMHWAFALGYMIMAIVADFVAGVGQYKSKKLNSLSYILFSLGGTGSYIVFFADPNGWAQTMLGNGTEQSYIDTMQATANTGILIAMFAAVIIGIAATVVTHEDGAIGLLGDVQARFLLVTERAVSPIGVRANLLHAFQAREDILEAGICGFKCDIHNSIS